ncbi:hypothetical protein GCM10009039_14890 [Halocalculus aciditolerans]|uniref:Uncharacterized protein n=1 Tax=Halocalculus aciditolerans TaxID=1383812 RepID=A0A830F315_9EURY|nr:hypothetical protein GCM10009039_14890 [Halocalculus aciditolerans]
MERRHIVANNTGIPKDRLRFTGRIISGSLAVTTYRRSVNIDTVNIGARICTPTESFKSSRTNGPNSSAVTCEDRRYTDITIAKNDPWTVASDVGIVDSTW